MGDEEALPHWGLSRQKQTNGDHIFWQDKKNTIITE
jgi:hypothetical protein